MIDVKSIRKDFPVYLENPGFVYLDSAATSLKPQPVIDAVTEYYSKYPANIHRGIYAMSEKASEKYEGARKKVAEFIGAHTEDEIVFTRNATEGLNLIAYTLGNEIVKERDRIITTIMEHHANFIPWQQLAFEKDADLLVIDIEEDGELAIGTKVILDDVVTNTTKIVALTYASNVLGTINPLKKIVKDIRKVNPKVVVIIDAAQAVPHMKIDVQDLDCDFLVFSSHKMCGPTGVGVLWGKKSLLNSMKPFNYGGDMIEEVHLDESVFAQSPARFEAGTPHIAGVIALKAAIEYLEAVGLDSIKQHEQSLSNFAKASLLNEFGSEIDILGPETRVGLAAFILGKVHPHDISQILDENNIAVRAGHHCAMPLHERLGYSATTRASFYLYNDESDVEQLVQKLKKAQSLLS